MKLNACIKQLFVQSATVPKKTRNGSEYPDFPRANGAERRYAGASPWRGLLIPH